MLRFKKDTISKGYTKNNLRVLALAIVAGLLLFFCSEPALAGSLENKTEGTEAEIVSSDNATTVSPSENGPGHNNVAALYCLELGYEPQSVEIKGNQDEVCVFPDGSSCNVWDFFSGKCGDEFSLCAQNDYDQIIKNDGKDPYSSEYVVCVDADTGEEIGSITELLGLFERFDRPIRLPVSGPAIVSSSKKRSKKASTFAAAAPSSFDWRNFDGQDWVTSVKNQSQCGSCWAFSAVGTTEAVYNISENNSNLDLDLSEEYLNSDACACGTCCGGWHSSALEFIRDNGIPDETCLPYDVAYYNTGDCSCFGRPGGCPDGIDPGEPTCTGLAGGSCSQFNAMDACADIGSRLTTIDGYFSVPSDQTQIKETLIEKGPLSICYAHQGGLNGDTFDCPEGYCRDTDPATPCNIGDTCPDGTLCGSLNMNHCIVMVGYDDTDGHWIVKNSWGSGYAGDGYFNIPFGDCLVENAVYYVEPGDIDQPPICDANGPYTAECAGETTSVSLDGTGSSDPDGDPISYEWTTDCLGGSFDDDTSPTPTLSVDSSNGCNVTCNVSLTVTDVSGLAETCETSVTIQDTVAPDITCPSESTIDCDESTDPDNTGDATATDDCDSNPTIDYSDIGITGDCQNEETITRTWTATDYCGRINSCVQIINVVDTTPPEIILSVMQDTLWPPNHKMVDVGLNYEVADNCDTEPDISIEVTSDEPTTTAPGAGGSEHAPDAEITDDGRILLRAERSGKGDGRVYVINVTAIDECGNNSSLSIPVKVNQNKKKDAINSGQSYDATQIN